MSMKDLKDAAIREVDQHFHCAKDTFIVLEELKVFYPGDTSCRFRL